MASTSYSGNGRVNGAGIRESQYFQSYDPSHITNPPARPATFTAQQKAEAIRLLNEGTPGSLIAAHIGGNCHPSYPSRWRAEEDERQRRTEAERQRQADIEWQHAVDVFQILVMPLLLLLLYLAAEVIGMILNQIPIPHHSRPRLSVLFLIWNIWKPAVCACGIIFRLPDHWALPIFSYSFAIYWICIILNIGRSTPCPFF